MGSYSSQERLDRKRVSVAVCAMTTFHPTQRLGHCGQVPLCQDLEGGLEEDSDCLKHITDTVPLIFTTTLRGICYYYYHLFY